MSAAGSREEMLEALQQVRQAMARRVPEATPNSNNNNNNNSNINSTGLQIYEGEESTPRPRPQVHSEAKDNRSHFFDTWSRKIEMFVADPTKTTLELPQELAANDRRELHMLAEKYNLSHHSRGTGATRQLILKKDALHYRMPDVRPDNLDAIKQNAGDKQSKFHLRRTRQDGDAAIGTIGAFGDEATAQMVRRLDRATDEYRKAVEVGYSQQELLALEAGETLESVLRSADTPQQPEAASEGIAGNVNNYHAGFATSTLHNTADNNNNNNNNNNNSVSTGEKKNVVYDEVCLRCGSRARVDYDVQKWECNGYCGECATQTIWKLVEVEVQKSRPEELILSPANAGRKRSRQESGIEEPMLISPAQRQQQEQREEIDKDNDEDDTITVEDVVDMANMNDFSAADVNWIRRFASHHQPQESKSVLSKHIVFCIEFNDLFSMRIFRDYLTNKENTPSALEQKEQTAWFVYLREVKDAGVHLSTLLEELTACIPEGYDRLSVAFPNMSVYGTAASCVCLVYSPTVEGSCLETLQRKYGRDNVRFSRDLVTVLENNRNSA